MAARYVENIGRRIRERREELDLSQGDIARELPGKVDANQVSRWERGLHKPNDATLEKIAQILKVEVSYFYADGPSRAAIEPADQQDDLRPLVLALTAQIERLTAQIDRLERGEGGPSAEAG